MNFKRISSYMPRLSWVNHEKKSGYDAFRTCELLDKLASDCNAGNSSWHSIGASEAFRYYDQISPVAKGANIIAKHFSSIRPQFYDNVEQSFVPAQNLDKNQVDFLRLIDKPNPNETGRDFKTKTSISDTVTGNVYILVSAINAQREPTEIEYVDPQKVTIQNNSGNQPIAYTVTNHGSTKTITYNKTIFPDGRIKFLDNTGMFELIAISRFNPRKEYIGLSPLSPIFYEFKQYEQSSIHNLSLLENGGTISLAVLLGENMTPEQARQYDELIQTQVKGAKNAGRILTLGGSKDVKNPSQTNKDMDFLQLRDDARMQIFTTLEIPLPLIKTDTMTYNNYHEAKAVFFDMTVIPTADNFYSDLLAELSDRYQIDTLRYELKVNPDTIPAIQEQRKASKLELSKSDRITDNEARELLGYEEIAGGDVIYKQSSLVPVGVEFDDEDDATNNMDEEKMRVMLERQTKANGDKRWTETDIDRIIKNARH